MFRSDHGYENVCMFQVKNKNVKTHFKALLFDAWNGM